MLELAVTNTVPRSRQMMWPESDAWRAAPSQWEAKTSQWLNPPKTFLYIQTAVTICLIIISFSGPLQLWEMVRTLSLSNVIVTAASLKPLSFLPGDSQQMTLFWNRAAYICLSLGWRSSVETLQMTRAIKLNYSGKVYRQIRAYKQWPHGPHVIYHGLSQKNWIIGLSVIIHLPWCLHKVRVH